MKIVNVEEMRRIEQATDERGHSYAAMMDMAGQSVAEAAMQLMLAGPGKVVLVLVGPGNNGGDGLVAARHLLESGHHVVIYVWRRDVKGEENFQRLKRRRRGVAILWSDNDPELKNLRDELERADLVIDALLGTGMARPIEGRLAEILAVCREVIGNRRSIKEEDGPAPELLLLPQFPIAEAEMYGVRTRPRDPFEDIDDFDEDFDEDLDDFDEAGPFDDIDFGDKAWQDGFEDTPDDYMPSVTPRWPTPAVVAVDCPTGLNNDTGELDPLALPADLTVTFAFAKWGQLQYPGAGACGLLGVAPIGVPPELAQEIQNELVQPSDIARLLPARPRDAHKGTFGKALVVAGSINFTGAAYLSGAAATRAGAGLVTLAIPRALHPALAGALPEVTWIPMPGTDETHCAEGVPHLLASLATYTALLIGPGLTTMPAAAAFIEQLFGPQGLPRTVWEGSLIADADALNILATLPDWPSRLPPGSILTPHPGELGRLTGMSPAELNRRRIETARRWAAEWGHVLLLKGAHTVIAAPDGRTALLPFANPALATAGSGDVLAGAIVAMLAQGLPAFDAAICGAYLHGHAAQLVSRASGPAGAVASDFLAQFPEALNQLYWGKISQGR